MPLRVSMKSSGQTVFCDLSDGTISRVVRVVADSEFGQSDEGEGDDEEGEEGRQSSDAWLIHGGLVYRLVCIDEMLKRRKRSKR